MGEDTKYSIQDQIWEVSYEYCKSLLLVYKNKKYFFTRNQSWNLMKWNALGNVLISKKAISMWLDNSELKKNTPALKFGGPRNKRCFVAEHIYPTESLKKRFKDQFCYDNLNKVEFKDFFRKYNRICYIWYTEDKVLNENGLKSTVSDDSDDDLCVFSRYKESDIVYISTRFEDGKTLFSKLSRFRDLKYSYDEIIPLIRDIPNA